MLCPDPEHTVGQWFRWAAAWRCVRHSSTFVSAPVGLDGRQPGNYTALTTSPERKAHCHTHIHKNTYLYVSIQIIQPHLHSQYLSPICSPPHTHTHTHIHTLKGPAKHKDYIMSRRITMTPTWPGCAAALPLAWVCLNLLFEGKDCPQFKQVFTYADRQLKHVVCISCCSGARLSQAQHVNWGWGSTCF